jgi:hypothetical protein
MSVPKRLSRSLVVGVLATVVFTLLAFYFDDKTLSPALMWQIKLFSNFVSMLMGPGPLLGYDQHGEPMYEGTPVLLFVGFFGILLGIPIYAALGYAAMALWDRRRRRGLR